MTFKHKLSRRLALLRGALLAAAGAFVACTASDSDRSVSGPTTADSVTSLSTGAVLFQENFEDTAFAGRGWYDNTAMAITDTTHVAGSTHALEVRFPAGATTPTWGGAARHLFTATPTLYVSYWVRYSSNWVGSGQPYHPHEFYVLSDMDGDYDGPSNNYLTLYIEENYQNGGIPRLAVQDNRAINTSYGAPPINLVGVTENRSTAGCNGVVETQLASECYNAPPWYNDKKIDAAQPYFLPAPGPGYKGNWNHVEAYFQLNSIASGIGQADGVMQYWFNGQLVIDRHDILYRTGARPSINFHQFIIAPYIGDGSPVDQTMWVDNLTVATAPLAPVTSPGTVTDLSATAATDTSVTLSFTEVNDGTGNAASYDVRYAPGTISWGSAADVTRGTCAVPMAGTTIGAKRTCTVLGLSPATAYQFQLVAYRGTLNLNAVFGGLSNVASKSTQAVAVASIAVAPATATIGVGAKQTFAATLRDASGNVLTGRTITWRSSSTAVATMKGATATGVSIGTTTISATSGGVTGSATLTVGAAVALVTVTPSTVSQAPGATQQLTATLKDSGGNVLTGRTITWSSSNTAVATVSSSGLEKGVAAGTATIRATSEGRTGSAAITVTTGTPGTVTDLRVAAVTDSSATLSFTEVNDGTGGPASYEMRFAPGTISWGSAPDVSLGTCTVPLAGTTIGATKSCTVLGLTASTAYQFQVVAFRGTLNQNAVFGTLSNVASGTTAAPPAPPPPSGGGTWPNEPAGWTSVNDYGMSGLNTGGWLNVYPADITGGGISVASDPGAPASPQAVWQFAYPTGFTAAGYAPATEWMTMAPSQALYVGFWWKPSNPWQGHESGVNKLMFMFTGDPAGLSQNMTMQLYGSGSGPFSTRMVGEGFEDVAYWENVSSTSPLALGVWHRVEILMNSPAGSLRWWVDGKLVGSYTGVPYPSYGFFQLEFSPTWGGVGTLAKQENDYFWFDQVHASHP